jgi:recombination protein RecR
MYSPHTRQLMDALRALPGVGPKSAQRLAFQLLSSSGKTQGLTLAQALQKALTHVGYCKGCRIYTECDYCDLCNNPKRDARLLCVVESPADVIAMEQTHSYTGLYFVLHGHLSPLDGIGPNEIGIPELLEKIKTGIPQEIVLATNPTAEGKATAYYIAAHVDSEKVKCTRLAHGVPVGGELEYLDSGTLMLAFSARTPLTTTD